MAEKKRRKYYIQMFATSAGGPVALSVAEVYADEIQKADQPGSHGDPMVLLLDGEEVGRFSNMHVVGWWTIDTTY